MADGPDVRALRYMAGHPTWRGPPTCAGCEFSDPVFVAAGSVRCELLGGPELVNPRHPVCTGGHWRERARTELDLLTADNALLLAVARDAREESSVYNRGLAEGAAAEREEGCKAVCSDCAAGLPAWRDVSGWWTHNTPEPGVPYRRCRADAIRRRAEENGR